MVIDCHACINGTTSDGESCKLCSGDGEIDLLDPAFRRIRFGPEKNLTGLIWSTLLTNQAAMASEIIIIKQELADLADKVDDVMDKCNDIFEKVNE